MTSIDNPISTDLLQTIHAYAENLADVRKAEGDPVISFSALCDNIRDDMVDVVNGTDGVTYLVEDYNLEECGIDNLPAEHIAAMLMAFDFSN